MKAFSNSKKKQKSTNKKKKPLIRRLRSKKTRRKIKLGIFMLATLTLSCFLIYSIFDFILYSIHPVMYIANDSNTLETTQYTMVGKEAEESTVTLTRGTEVHVREKGDKYSTVTYNGMTLKIANDNLASSIEECIQTDYVYPRRLVNLQKKKNGALVNTVVEKGEKVKVTNVDVEDFDPETGQVDYYQVEKDGKTYYLRGLYCEGSEKAATKNYASNINYSTYWDYYYYDGYSKDAYIDQIDYKPFQKNNYESNQMPEAVNAIHVNLENLVKDKDFYKSMIKKSGVNAIVVEMKDDEGYVYYPSDAVEKHFDDPENGPNKSIILSYDGVVDLIKEFQDAGFYMIARIVTFKDKNFAEQHKDCSITGTDGDYFIQNDVYWPSAYSREAWMYNVDLGKELAEMGFKEIQFDYVRFPDGTYSVKDQIDLKNTYNESKAAALQGFLMYAYEELKEYEVYVAADVFAWPVVAEDDQDTGQFFPALANVVDVISPMPYTDHFSEGAMGIEDPTAVPGETIYEFSEVVKKEMKGITNGAIYRTWIQGYSLKPGKVKEEIKAINKAGYSGYMVWDGHGDKEDIEYILKGCIDSTLKEEDE